MLNCLWIDADQFPRLKKISGAWAFLLKWDFQRGANYDGIHYSIKNYNTCIVGVAQKMENVEHEISKYERCTDCTNYAESLCDYVMCNDNKGFKIQLDQFMTHFENEHQKSIMSKIVRFFR